MTASSFLSGRGAHLGQHLAHGFDRAGNAPLAELSHAADAEGFQRGELSRIEDIAARLHRVIEALEGVAWAVRCEEGHDDRCLYRRRQKAAQAESCHALDQRTAIEGVARMARLASAFLEI